jgi:Acetyl-coenzyme A synthetase N-terminus
MSDTYDAVYNCYLRDPQKFWAKTAGAVHWNKKWERVLDDSRPPCYRSFPGGLLNTCYNGLGRADRHHSPVTLPHGHRVRPAQCQSAAITPNGSDEGTSIM